MSSFPHSRSAPMRGAILALTLLAAAPLAPLAAGPADARAGGGFSFGSRGSRSFSPPAYTNTAPSGAQPFQRSESTNPSFGGGGGFAGQPRRFGFGSGLAAGLLGAGLFGLLTGNGFFGGLGGLMSLIGLLVQIGIIVLIVRFVMAFFRRGPVMAGGPTGAARGLGGGLPGGDPGRRNTVPIQPQDFHAFEAALVDMQTAYGREDMNAISRLATPEMTRFLGQDLDENRRRGVHNEVSDPRLLQGDLSESWREGMTDYASVAMRFSALDWMVDRASGRTVSGDPARPVEATEIWTFRRNSGAPWLLTGIQQVA